MKTPKKPTPTTEDLQNWYYGRHHLQRKAGEPETLSRLYYYLSFSVHPPYTAKLKYREWYTCDWVHIKHRVVIEVLPMDQIRQQVLDLCPAGSIITEERDWGRNAYLTSARWLIAKGFYSEQDGNEQERLKMLRQSWKKPPSRALPTPTPEAMNLWLSDRYYGLEKGRSQSEIIPDVYKLVHLQIALEGQPHRVEWVILEEGSSRRAEEYRDYIQADLEELIGGQVHLAGSIQVCGKQYRPATRWLIANGFCTDVATAEYQRKKLLKDMGP
jgi:hypothetical protein